MVIYLVTRLHQGTSLIQYLPKTADKQKLVSTSDSADYTPCVAVDDSAPHIVVECGTGLADGEKETDKASLI